MKSRKFEIEWQLYKTYFKNRMPAKTAEEMRTKMETAKTIYYSFIDDRSRELAYNVINWMDGLVIAFRDNDERRGIIEEAIKEIKEHWNSGEGAAPRMEPDDSFGYEAIEDFINNPSSLYREVTGSSSFDWKLLFENMVHNLDMLNKWLQKAYVHDTAIEYVHDTMKAAEEFNQELPKKVLDRWTKLVDRYDEIQQTGEKSTHKFLY